MAGTELDFQDQMIAAVEANCNLFTYISFPLIPPSSNGTPQNGISFTLIPMGQAFRNYDGQWDKTFAFQVTCRHTDQLTALNALLSIGWYVDGLNPDDIKSQNGSFYFVNGQVTSPNFLLKDDYGYVYTSMHQAELLLY
ncbi:hypothetical protein [Sporolactobacillus pectinivorans]|uniref:hypothetical protein n=1 Tax=Sporolactobacillus pectinivorans TaxID=1591408 RepID=UPI000C25DFE0|nr:hypothetical protein [Sporolactobacillus pectinivorans]